MKLRCIKPMIAHWGVLLIPDKIYGVIEIKKVSTEIIIDYDNYWKHMILIQSSIEWIMKGYTQEKLPEVIPGYLTLNEVKKRYAKKIEIPFGFINCSVNKNHTENDNKIKQFCLLSDKEVFDLGADINKNGKELGRPAFRNSIYMIDDYFDYNQIRREEKLNKLGI